VHGGDLRDLATDRHIMQGRNGSGGAHSHRDEGSML
jgi:hypothetical protein